MPRSYDFLLYISYQNIYNLRYVSLEPERYHVYNLESQGSIQGGGGVVWSQPQKHYVNFSTN